MKPNKYTKLIWWEGENVIQFYPVSTLNGYKKNKLIITSTFNMYVDAEETRYDSFKKFKGEIIKHYNDKIKQIKIAGIKNEE